MVRCTNQQRWHCAACAGCPQKPMAGNETLPRMDDRWSRGQRCSLNLADPSPTNCTSMLLTFHQPKLVHLCAIDQWHDGAVGIVPQLIVVAGHPQEGREQQVQEHCRAGAGRHTGVLRKCATVAIKLQSTLTVAVIQGQPRLFQSCHAPLALTPTCSDEFNKPCLKRVIT